MGEAVGGRRLARMMALVAAVGAVLTPLTVIVLWSTLGDGALAQGAGFSLVPDPSAEVVEEGARRISGLGRIVGGAVSMAFTIPLVVGLLSVRLTFLECAEGRPFSPRSVVNFRRFAWASLIGAVLHALRSPIMSAAITGLSPALQGQFVITVGSPEIGELFSALLLVTLAHVFAEGRRMADDVEGLL